MSVLRMFEENLMTAELQLGGTYRHYKTKGLYTALQLVMFEKKDTLFTDQGICEVTFTGDGPADDKEAQLYLSFVPSVKLYLKASPVFESQLGKQQVLYFSHTHKCYFARPLSEFVARVEVEAPVVRSDGVKGLGYSSVPRFELQK